MLFAAFVVLFYWAQNLTKVRPAEVVPALGVVVAGTAVVDALLVAAWREFGRAALATTAAIGLFFTYGFAFDWSATLALALTDGGSGAAHLVTGGVFVGRLN